MNEENGYEFQKVMKRENEDEVDEGPDHKRPRMDVEGREGEEGNSSRSASSVKDKDLSPSKKIRLVSTSSFESCGSISNRDNPWRIDTGIFSKVPPELYRHILKFLSSEVLIFCFYMLDNSYVHVLFQMPCCNLKLMYLWCLNCRTLFLARWFADFSALLLLMKPCGVDCELHVFCYGCLVAPKTKICILLHLKCTINSHLVLFSHLPCSHVRNPLHLEMSNNSVDSLSYFLGPFQVIIFT